MPDKPTENRKEKILKAGVGSWTPDFIVYAKMTFEMKNGHLEFSVVGLTKLFKDVPLETFVGLAALGQLPAPTMEVIPTKGATYDTPLDVFVFPNTEVVIELDRDRNWQFSRTGAALTTKSDYGQSNAELVLYTDRGVAVDPTSPAPDGCRLVSFRAITRTPRTPGPGGGTAFEAQHFNLHVELTPKGLPPIEMMIDPDFPNDGGHIPPPLR